MTQNPTSESVLHGTQPVPAFPSREQRSLVYKVLEVEDSNSEIIKLSIVLKAAPRNIKKNSPELASEQFLISCLE